MESGFLCKKKWTLAEFGGSSLRARRENKSRSRGLKNNNSGEFIFPSVFFFFPSFWPDREIAGSFFSKQFDIVKKIWRVRRPWLRRKLQPAGWLDNHLCVYTGEQILFFTEITLNKKSVECQCLSAQYYMNVLGAPQVAFKTRPWFQSKIIL